MDQNLRIVEKIVGNKKMSIETGKLAKQANASVVVRYGDTAVLVTVTASESTREGIDFLPLLVDYEEKLYAAGKIPGGFIKREGRPSEKCILTSRLIDRPVRPLINKGMRNDIQIVAMTLSADQENDPDIPAMIGASAALCLSDIPFNNPIASVRVGKIDDKLVINPSLQELDKSKVNIIVTATKNAIVMVEGMTEELTEEDMLSVLEFAFQEIKNIIPMIEELAQKSGKPKREYHLYEPDKTLEDLMRKYLIDDIEKAMRIVDKLDRKKAFENITKEAIIEAVQKLENIDRNHVIEILLDAKNPDFNEILDKIQEEELEKMILDEGLRPDGRKFDEIRPISCETGLLPRTHGSGLFTRGQTQVLSTVTMGTFREAQRIDDIGIEEDKRYMHQYNFPPFSVGEVRPLRGPGRREIGHGNLAERAIVPILPDEEKFPYALRVVSEVLESNGSSSMASTCASSMALMDAGVPIKEAVAGIAMGLVKKGDKFVVLTDIQGLEDHYGKMDFKITGTKNGITAIQMDIKIQGLTFEILKTALHQAKTARLHILEKMNACIPQAREELSQYAPKIIFMEINPEKIKDVIGPGGKIINKIIKETGAQIDIEDDGKIYVAAVNQEKGRMAKAMIDALTRDISEGEVYQGRVTRIMNFGAFVEILPNKEGLLHISQIAPFRVGKVEDVLNIGDEVTVRVYEIDSQGRINLTAKGLNNNFPEKAERF